MFLGFPITVTAKTQINRKGLWYYVLRERCRHGMVWSVPNQLQYVLNHHSKKQEGEWPLASGLIAV